MQQTATPEVANPSERESFAEFEPGPLGRVQKWVIAVWGEALDRRDLSLDDDFFDQGGDATRAARVLETLGHVLGTDFPADAIEQAPTVRRFARAVDQGKFDPFIRRLAIPLQPDGDRPTFFCVAPVGGNVIGYLRLASHLAPDQPFWGLQPPPVGFEGQGPLDFAALCERFVVEMRGVQPKGPYYIGGYSSGGHFAFEMARRLIEAGEKVAFVAILDTSGGEKYSILEKIRLRLHLLAQSPLRGLRMFFLEYQIRAYRWITVRLITRRTRRGGGVPKHLQQRRLASTFAFRNRQLQPTAVRTTLFRGVRRPGLRRRNERLWQTLVPEELLRIRDISGTHVTMMTEPLVQETAAILREEIEAVRKAR